MFDDLTLGKIILFLVVPIIFGGVIGELFGVWLKKKKDKQNNEREIN